MTAGGDGGTGGAAAPAPEDRRRAPPPQRGRRASGALAVAAVVLVVLGAPAAGASTTSTTRAPRLVPTRGGTVTVALDQVPTTLNDHTVAGDTPDGRMVASALWPQVFRVGPGLVPQLDLNVVDSAEVVSLNPQTVVYKIDRRAVWSDGVPISAADFTYAWQSQRGGALDVDGTPDSVASTLGYDDIASLTGSNHGRTVTVVFRTPFADWESLFDDLLPAHVAERAGWNQGFSRFDPSVLVSGGPWKVVAWVPGSQIVLGRNPRWWGSSASLAKVVIDAVPGSQALSSGLGGGRVQVAYPGAFDQSFLAQAASSSTLQSASSLGATMVQLEFNVTHAPLTSASARQGLAHLVNRPGLVSNVGQPENHSVWLDDDHLFANLQAGYNDDAVGYETVDPVTGTKLLQQSGLTLTPHGVWMTHGKPVTLVLVWAGDDPWSAATGPVIAAQLVAAGFSVVSDPVPSAQLYGSVLPTGSFDLAVVPVAASAYPSTMGDVFSSSPALSGGAVPEDYSGFVDPKIDTLFTQAVQNLDPPAALGVYHQIDEQLWLDMPTLPLFAEPTVVVWSTSLANVGDDPGGLGPLWGMRLWATLAPAPKSKAAP